MADEPHTIEPRQLSAWLLVGMLAAPGLFAWFTLARGYSRTLRYGAFANAAMAYAMGAVRAFGSP